MYLVNIYALHLEKDNAYDLYVKYKHCYNQILKNKVIFYHLSAYSFSLLGKKIK